MTDKLTPVRCGCGGETAVIQITDRYFISCKNCGMDSGIYDTEAEAVQAWNRAMGERTAKVETVEMPNPKNLVWKCAECGQYMHPASWARETRYCSYCGARLEWE